MRVLHVDGTLDGWREVARDLLASGTRPGDVSLTEEVQLGLFPGFVAEAPARYAAGSGGASPQSTGAPRVPVEFVSLARRVACHRAPSRWDRLYRLLWRTVNDGARILEDPTDEDVLALTRMAEAVRHDVHRVHALVRFRRVAVDGVVERFVAFHRPEHRTLALAAPFFTRRFAAMRWSILTPDASAHWDCRTLAFGPGVPRDVGASDDAEALWRTYYASTFNPARVNPRLLRGLLPQRHWDTLPEGRDIAALVRSARVTNAVRRLECEPSARDAVDDPDDLLLQRR